MLVVIGDLVEDVIAWRSGSLDRATDNPAHIVRKRGGSAANVAAAAARLVPTRFVGRVGRDPVASRLTSSLESAGVDVKVQTAGETGTVIILVDEDGERTMIPDRAAASELSDVDPAWLVDARWLHMTLYGFLLPSSRKACIAAAHEVHRLGASVSVDLSSVWAIREMGAELGAVLKEVSPEVVIANADEAAEAAEADLRGAAGVLVIKGGADPVKIVGANGTTSIPVPPVDGVRDTTGAGDAFAAGFTAARLLGSSDVEAATAGVALAARSLRSIGASVD
jgi:sugar/nucleoside kinase (ribokinase family)